MPTKFESWIRGYGVNNVSRVARCSRFAVYKWIRGDSMPRTHRMLVLSKVSGGELTFDDIVRHFASQRSRTVSEVRAAFEQQRRGGDTSSTSCSSKTRVAVTSHAKSV